LQSSPPSEA